MHAIYVVICSSKQPNERLCLTEHIVVQDPEYLDAVADGLDNGWNVGFGLGHGLVGSQEEDVVVPAKLSHEEERFAQVVVVVAPTRGGVAQRRPEQLLEPPELDTEGGVQWRHRGDVLPLVEGQVQRRRPDHREVGARAEVLAVGQVRRHELKASPQQPLHAHSYER